MVSEARPQVAHTISVDQNRMHNGYEDAKPVYRSYKKKYRKMRLKFDDDMRRSNELYRMEQDANATIKRIAQFNSQILDMLLDNNSCPQVPPEKRFDLSIPHPTIQPLPPLVEPSTVASLKSSLTTSTHRELHESIQDLLAEKSKHSTNAMPPATSKSLSSLLSSTPHPSTSTSPQLVSEAVAELDPPPLRYLATEELDAYLDGLDSANPAAIHPTMTTSELSVRNPHSVYNWLRINEPKVFLQDGEGSERSSVKAAGGASRNNSKKSALPAPTPLKNGGNDDEDEEMGYEGLEMMEGLVTGTGGKSKGKRKRGGDDDDGGYHPKQGRVEDGKGKKVRKSRPKKSEDGTPGGSAKRSRKSKGESTIAVDGIVVKEEATLGS